MRLTVPIEVTEDEGRELLVTELAKPEYTNARPTLIDQVGQAIAEWLDSLLSGGAGEAPPLVPFLVALAIAALVVTIAVLVYGPPRRNRRAAAGSALFGADERRSADELRAAARTAARRGDWSAAVLESYRAAARGLAERELVRVLPGTTAAEFATLAATPFPAEAAALAEAAAAFDDVRYLAHAGTRAQFESIAALDARMVATRPVLPELAATAPGGSA